MGTLDVGGNVRVHVRTMNVSEWASVYTEQLAEKIFQGAEK